MSMEIGTDDRLIAVVGQERMRAVDAIRRIHFWKSQAHMSQFGIRPRSGWTIKAFNETYGKACRNWLDVEACAADIITQMHAAREAADGSVA